MRVNAVFLPVYMEDTVAGVRSCAAVSSPRGSDYSPGSSAYGVRASEARIPGLGNCHLDKARQLASGHSVHAILLRHPPVNEGLSLEAAWPPSEGISLHPIERFIAFSVTCRPQLLIAKGWLTVTCKLHMWDGGISSNDSMYHLECCTNPNVPAIEGSHFAGSAPVTPGGG